MTELSGKRIVMTGATGFIGSHVAKRFLDERGQRCTAWCVPESQKTECLPVHEHLHRIPAQMDEAVECVPQIGHADAFLHFAWRGVNRQEIDSFEVQKTNIDGSLRCIEAAKLLGCQGIYGCRFPRGVWNHFRWHHGGVYGMPSGQRIRKGKAGVLTSRRSKEVPGAAADVLPSAVFQCLRQGGPSVVHHFHADPGAAGGERPSP